VLDDQVDPGLGVEESGRNPGRLIDLMPGRVRDSIFVEGAEPRRLVNPDDRFACPVSPQETTASATTGSRESTMPDDRSATKALVYGRPAWTSANATKQ
jgi:hypothetical protein